MSLDPQTNAFLELGKAHGGPGFAEMTVTEARLALTETMRACAIERSDVGAVLNTSIDGPGGAVELRCYHPPERSESGWPVLLFFHGGAWSLSSLDEYDSLCRFLCTQSSSVVVSVDFRLAPEHKFPAGLEDCYIALRWAADNVKKLGGDAEKIVVIGDSSGGNFAAAICHMARDRQGPDVARQILLCPLLALEKDPPFSSRKSFGGGEYFISRESLQWSVEMYLSNGAEAANSLASPLRSQDFSGLPMALVITAGYDPLRDEGAAYYARLVDAGTPAQYKCFESTIHGFLSFGGVLDVGREGLLFISDWVRNSFGQNRDEFREHA